MKYKKINLIAIAGGSASGKTTVAEKIAEACNKKNVIFVQMDNYYHDLSNLKVEERKKTNFDHPNAIDMKLLIHDLEQLLLGNAIEEPIYDFKINSRSKNTEIIGPGDVIILDGIFALENPIIRELSTIKIFVDTDSDTRLLRRIKRDVSFRNRTLDSVLQQYALTVKPMHDAFVEPTKRYADIIIPFDFHNTVAIDIIATKIKAIIK
ncbi:MULTISPECIES: uridine kinase [unclassified Spiroplasma]|uniref:uridine kinase n=2 Tax=unclassified Spiroplasma TaxID=2637901 RepID=UPI00157A9CF3|nr:MULTISPECIES: uridine kinase [unclassified Spiroplasma]WDA54167.1 MAG: uridine kinase [Spiroplasma endosymbiont of Drosophila atripex]